MFGRGTRAGFTLIEILVVISITMVLIGLIFGPVVQTFNLTRQANAMVQAQDTARTTLELISRELSQAMFVYDNSCSPIVFPVQQPAGGVVQLDQQPLALYGKVDLILPKLIMHCNRSDHPANQPRDYERGDDAWPLCPACLAANIKVGPEDVECRPKQPLAQDSTVVRYFIGLANNDPNPATPYGGPGAPSGAYRDWPESGSPLNGFILYRAEIDFRDATVTGLDLTDPSNLSNVRNLFPMRTMADGSEAPDLDYPYFFYSEDPAPNGKPYWQNWKAIAKPVGPQTDTDLVVLKMDPAGTAIEGITPSARFQLTQVTNDSLTPAYMSDASAEVPASIPAVFRGKYGSWGEAELDSLSGNPPSVPPNYDVTVARYNPVTSSNDIWFKTYWDWNNTRGKYDLMLGKYDLAGNLISTVLNITQLDADLKNPALVGRGTTFAPNAQPEIAFIVDASRGEVRFDMPGFETIGYNDIGLMNAQVNSTWAGGATPGATGPIRAYRISLFRSITQSSAYQPRIVPGSEVVTGPDMTPGLLPDQRRMVRYERVPLNLGDPGRNQYKIDYGIDDRVGNRVGWIFFSPRPDEIIPEMMLSGQQSRIDISYKFQLDHDGDVVTANYTTKNLMTITLGIRYYDRNSGKVHPVELTNKVNVRNLLR